MQENLVGTWLFFDHHQNLIGFYLLFNDTVKMNQDKRRVLAEGIEIIQAFGLPTAQQNERSTSCLLTLLDISLDETWQDGKERLIGITPIINFVRRTYGKDYAPNTRETIRRQSMHQFVDAGIAQYNPDEPNRPVNSPKAVYQIEQETSKHLTQKKGMRV